MSRARLLGLATLQVFWLMQGCLFTPEKKPEKKAIKSNGHYRISFKQPATTIHGDSSYSIQWVRLDSAVSDSARIRLFRMDALVKTITPFSLARGDTGTYLWTVGTVAAGDGYRLKITDAGDSSKWDFGATFSIQIGYSGSIRITSPYAGEIRSASLPIQVAWTTTGSPEPSYLVELYLEETPISISPSKTSGAPGTVDVYFPFGLKFSDRYRIRLTSGKDTSQYSYSAFFTIQGEPPDAYEIDDSAAQAKIIHVNAWQKRTLTFGDLDWIRFSAVKGMTYLISLRPERGQYIEVSDSALAPANATMRSQQSLLIPGHSGNFLVKVQPLLIGPYEIGLSAFDTTLAGFPGAFSSPGADSVWLAGSAHALLWNMDSLLFRQHGKLELLRAGHVVQEIAEDYSYYWSGSPATGPYVWNIDPWVATGAYSIRMVNRAFPQFCFQSPVFSISGLTPDAFEPDDSIPGARALPADTLQDRNLTQGDSDWVYIDARPGRFYSAGAYMSGHQFRGDIGVGLFNPYMGGDLLDKDGKVLSSQVGPNLQFQFLADYAGKYFLRLYQVKGSGGVYHVRLREYDSAMTAAPIRFITPDSNSAWRSGETIELKWVPDSAMFGEAVKLDLHLEDGRKSILSNGNFTFATPTGSMSVDNAAMNTGTFKWLSSSALTYSNRYRIKITNAFNPKIHAFSAYFTLLAPEDDSLEPNNDRPSATPLTSNRKWENLSLTYGDSDWYRFQGTSDRIYCIRLASLLPHASKVRMDLSGDQQMLESISTDTANYLPWYCPKDSLYAFEVDVNGTWQVADYSLDLKEVLPQDYAWNIAAPAAGVGFQASGMEPLLVEWSSRVNVGANVRLYLYNSNGQVGFIGSTSDAGRYAWKTRSGRLENGVKIAAGSDYYIRIISWLNPKFAANSAVFSITP